MIKISEDYIEKRFDNELLRIEAWGKTLYVLGRL